MNDNNEQQSKLDHEVIAAWLDVTRQAWIDEDKEQDDDQHQHQ